MPFANDETNPKAIEITVVAPVRNEESSVRALLESLLGQSFPPTEIVITDGGSTDATKAIIQEFITAGAPVKLISEEAALPGRGRNIGVQNSSSEWIAFTDGGNRPAHDWLESLAAKARGESPPDLIYGSYSPITDSFFKECAAIAYVTPPEEIDGTLARSRSIASALVRRRAWQVVGGFPENLRSAEDLLFMNAVEQAGFRVARAPQAIVYWTIQSGFLGTFRRFSVYARHNLRAGLWRNWQAPILRRYAVIAVALIPAAIIGLKWLLLPVLLWVGLLLSRAFTALARNRRCYRAGIFRNLFRLGLIVPILVTLDAATINGTIWWLIKDKISSLIKHGHNPR
ncbi:MAG: glycosyltransferase [Pyrinomonadaceae bacterium]